MLVKGLFMISKGQYVLIFFLKLKTVIMLDNYLSNAQPISVINEEKYIFINSRENGY